MRNGLLSFGTELTASDCRRYEEDGYLFVEGILPQLTLAAIKVDTARLCDAPTRDTVLLDRPVIWCWRHRPDGQRSIFPLDASRAVHDLVTDVVVHNMCRRLTGTDYLQLFECVVFDKPAGIGEAFVWHNDKSYYPVEPGRSISLWIAIDRCDEENGALKFAKGSHRHGRVRPVDVKTGVPMKGSEAVALPDPEAAGYSVELLEMDAGDGVFFDASTWHASPPNRSRDRRRRGMVLRFWVEPNRYAPTPGTAALFTRQVTCGPGEYISGPCFPVFDYRK